MTRPDDDSAGIRQRSPTVRKAWERTIEDMRAVAEDRRNDGWDVVAVPAINTSPVSKSQGDDPTRFGLVHVIPDNHADAFSEALERGEFPKYQVYRNQVDGYVYLVTELLDPNSETVVLVAAQYDTHLAKGMIRSVLDEDAIFSHFKTINGTPLGSVRHDDIDPFLPDDE